MYPVQTVEIELPKHYARLVIRILENHSSSDVNELRQIGETVSLIEDMVNRLWDSERDQLEKCKCGHAYERHFDSYEDMYPVGCKYCECWTFESN